MSASKLSNVDNLSERATLASLLDAGDAPLPPALAAVLDFPNEFAPEYRPVVFAIRDARAGGEPLSSITVAKHLQPEHVATLLSLGNGDALPLTLAEAEAEALLQRFRGQAVLATLGEAYEAATKNPAQAEIIAQHVCDALQFATAQRATYTARPISDLDSVDETHAEELIRHRFLCKGGGMLLAAPSGIGKSTFALQMLLCFAAGRECIGFTPARKLRALYLQAENDDADLRELRDGILAGLQFSTTERETALTSVHFATVDDLCGEAFIREAVAPLCESVKPDLLVIDPLLSFIGGDISKQEVVSPWLRNCLNPVLHRQNVGCVLIHHTNKPPSGKEKSTWQAGDFAYSGSGSSELANWPRAVVAIRSLGSHSVFELRLGKRGQRAHWRNPDGTPSFARHIAHATDGIFWRMAEPTETPAEPGRKPGNSVSDILELLADQKLSTVEWQKACREEAGISERSFFRLLSTAKKAKEVSQSKIDKKWFKAP
jgi:hypothetical protein